MNKKKVLRHLTSTDVVNKNIWHVEFLRQKSTTNVVLTITIQLLITKSILLQFVFNFSTMILQKKNVTTTPAFIIVLSKTQRQLYWLVDPTGKQQQQIGKNKLAVVDCLSATAACVAASGGGALFSPLYLPSRWHRTPPSWSARTWRSPPPVCGCATRSSRWTSSDCSPLLLAARRHTHKQNTARAQFRQYRNSAFISSSSPFPCCCRRTISPNSNTNY